jgi:hypothetical protein
MLIMAKVLRLEPGGWQLTAKLGKGGNGVVYKGKRGNEEAAVKILHPRNWGDSRMNRFRDEVESMERCRDLDGVLPLLDWSLPTAPRDAEPPWFAMALAEPIRLRRLSLHAVVGILRDVARTLAAMHERGISHRDLKPDNLFTRAGRGVVGDLGLCHFDGKQAETATGEKLGPVYYIAPEMLNAAASSDGKQADVYSFAKVLWVMTTGQRFPLPGQHDRSHTALTVSAYVSDQRANLLDRLIEAATAFDPGDRPTMARIASALDEWLLPPEVRLVTDDTDLLDLTGAFAARKERIDLVAKTEQGRVQQDRLTGARFREAIRHVADFVLRALTQAGFMAGLSIDNYEWGFGISATAPWINSSKFVKLQLTACLAEFKAGGVVRLKSEYIAETVRSGSVAELRVLWKHETEYLEGGPEEAPTIARLERGIREQLRESVAAVVALSSEP